MKLFLLTFILLIFLGGCSSHYKYLNASQKKEIYKSIQEEIAFEKIRGDLAYLDGFYLDALDAYKKLNYYEEKRQIPLSTMQNIKQQAKQSAKKHYNLAKKFIKAKEYTKALLEYNAVIKSRKYYKDTKQNIKKLKAKREVRLRLIPLQDNLKSALLNNKNDFQSIKAIKIFRDALANYDLLNPLLKTADKTINTSTYKLAVFKELKENKMLAKAQQSLKKEDFNKAIMLAKKVLKNNPKSMQAKNIIKQARNESNKKIEKLLEKGKKLYDAKKLSEALKVFKKTLKVSPQNSESLIYIRKIKMQLKTIQNLE